MRAKAIMAAVAASAVWSSAAVGGDVPVATAGVATRPADVARCEAVRRAFRREDSFRVLPPEKPIKLRARPVRLSNFPKWEAADVPVGSCSLYFWVAAPFDDAPVVDRVTGLMWFGRDPDDDHEMLDIREAPAVIRRINAARMHGFSDWRLPTTPELLTLAREIEPFPRLLRPPTWSADRVLQYQLMVWSRDEGSVVWTGYSPLYGQRAEIEVRPVRTMKPPAARLPRVTAGAVGGVEELAPCRLFEWTKFAEGRAAPVMPRDRPARMRADPTPLEESALADQLSALFLLHDDGRCFVNDYRPLADGTVLDAATGLAWEVGRSESRLPWSEAWPYVYRQNDARYLGHDDWRLPTVEEAATLIESVRFLFPNTRLDPTVFATSAEIWTADPRADEGHDETWVLDTETGEFRDSHGITFVKMVRSIAREGE